MIENFIFYFEQQEKKFWEFDPAIFFKSLSLILKISALILYSKN